MTPPPRSPAAVRADALARLGLQEDAAARMRVSEPTFEDRTLLFSYDLPDVGSFQERFRLEGLPEHIPQERWDAALAAARFGAVFAATSYYKAVIPPVVEVDFPLSEPARALAREVFEDGLGEFAYRNGTSLQGHVSFEAPTGPASAAGWDLEDRPLVPVGGGKDSIVSLEATREHFDEVRSFAVNPKGAILRTVEHAATPHVSAHRSLDPALFDLNDRGALNGHVPITAIVSAVAVVAALLDGDRWVVMSNEASADQGNVTVDGIEVNHQYAKSSSFEHRFAGLLRAEVHRDLGYLSMLRPLSELTIARAFARLTDYHGIFNSCNRAFKLRGETTDWCGDCPKCRFVFLALAPFLSREQVLTIFSGRDLLDDESQRQGFRELLGLADVKPWECVGTFDESRAALGCLAERPEWSRSRLVAELSESIAGGCDEVAALADAADTSGLPHPFDGIVDGLR